MKNNVTELVFILDKSGSMSGMEKDTVGGFNAMLEKQKALEGKAYVSTVLFSNASEVLHDRKTLEEIPPLTEKDYQVGGCTALLDAIGGAIRHIGNIHKYARAEDVPERTVFVITTDGMENASREYSASKIKEMIRRQEEKYGWEFLFVAANIDAVETAESIGIRKERAANYCVEEDTEVLFKEMSETLCRYRKMGVIPNAWANNIERNYNKRKRNAQNPENQK
ncbi:MAG: VWA domain-containing protein [Clostridia bacterium]|nr:VWA domain-containing protein [Clostridia bacterium]